MGLSPAKTGLLLRQLEELLRDASRRRFDILLVWRMDRAFRSVLDAATTLERLRAWGIGLRFYSEPWLDTTSPFGEALYYITVAYAQLERGILRERVKAGMVEFTFRGIPWSTPSTILAIKKPRSSKTGANIMSGGDGGESNSPFRIGCIQSYTPLLQHSYTLQ